MPNEREIAVRMPLLHALIDEEPEKSVELRPSSKGNYLGITITITANDQLSGGARLDGGVVGETVVPEPSTLVLLGAGLLAGVVLRFRR